MDTLSPANTQRMLNVRRTEELLKAYLPATREDALSYVMYEQGLREKTAKEYIKLLFSRKKFDYNKAGLLIWTKK